MTTNTLKELITEYGVPLEVKKPKWYGDYFFRAETVNRNGTVTGTIIQGGLEHENKSFSESEIMELTNLAQAKKKANSSAKKVSNPNKLDTDKSHYISGVTKLFVKKADGIKPAIFIRFDVKEGNDVIYVKVQGKSEAGFYSFPSSHYVFPNKDDAQSSVDKEYRKFGLSPSHSIIKAFQTKPQARKPSEDRMVELDYEKGYHKQVDGKLQSDLVAPQRKKDEALHDKHYADADLRKAIGAAREDGCLVDDHTYISHHIRKETADARIAAAQDEISKIESVRRKPYFARIDCGTSMKKLHTVYLGDEDIGDYVVSWRHPEYGNAYYQSGLIQGRGDIVLALKRIVNILSGRFEGFDDDINLYSVANGNLNNKDIPINAATDELLTRLLQESRADKTTHEIIKTIQGEQYDIITSDFTQNAVINGCAGSGKTMIMYHRLSYMAYNYLSYLGREFNPDAVYIISPSDLFDSNNDELLAKLSINSVHQSPFYAQIETLLDSYCTKHNMIPFYGIIAYIKANGNQPKNFFSTTEFNKFNSKCKSADTQSFEYKRWVLDIANMILEEQEFKPISWPALPNTVKGINALFATTDYYYNNCFMKKGTTRLYSKLAVTEISLDNIMTALKYVYDKTSPQYLQRKKRISNSMGLLKCCLALKPKLDSESKITTDIPDFWSLVSSATVYEKMLSVIAAEHLLEMITDDTDKSKAYLLPCLWAYKNLYTDQLADLIKLYLLQFLSKKFGPVIDDPALIFIDEFQNYAPFEIQCLKSAYESPVFNLFGDYDQRIEEKGLDLKSKLSSLLSPNFYNININYRNAKPITEYINRQVHKNMQSIGVNGIVIETHIDQCEFKISDRTAIICKDPKLALLFLKRYIDSSKINNSTTTKELSRDKFTLITVLDCKGLEFDTVYVLNYGMTENEKYVAYTRALDTLIVISDDLEAIKKAEEEAEKRKKDEERLRKKEEQEQKKKLILYTRLLNVLSHAQAIKTSSANATIPVEEIPVETEKTVIGVVEKLADPSPTPIKYHQTKIVDYGPSNELEVPIDRKPEISTDAHLSTNQRLEDEIKKLQAYRAELERKEQEARKATLEKTTRLYALAKSKAEADDTLQLTEAILLLETIGDYADSIEMLAKAKAKIAYISKLEEERIAKEKQKEQVYITSLLVFNNCDNITELEKASIALQTILDWKDSLSLLSQIDKKIRQIKTETQKSEYRRQKVCQHCGGKFKGLFKKYCSVCKHPKDY